MSNKELNLVAAYAVQRLALSLPCQQSSCKLRFLLFGIVTGGLASGRVAQPRTNANSHVTI